MRYFEKFLWSTIDSNELKFNSEELSKLSVGLVAYEKTYNEGVSVIRGIYCESNVFIVVSLIESRVSGPAESKESIHTSRSEAEASLLELCKEDDEFYV